jgi:hypothetical protein
MGGGSRSKFIESNGLTEKILDSGGAPLRGEAVTAEGGEAVILRFAEGLLNGDTETGAGVAALPAVEAPGHIEFWRGGRLHRDNGLPAVQSDGYTVCEWWENGKRVR